MIAIRVCVRVASREEKWALAKDFSRASILAHTGTHDPPPPPVGTLISIYRAIPARAIAPSAHLCLRSVMTTGRPLFSLSLAADTFGPRTGTLCIDRGDGSAAIEIETPALLTATSRGLVPHLSQDNIRLTEAVQLIELPFESL